MARGAMVAPFAALAVMWIARQLERKQTDSVASAINFMGSTLSVVLIVAGIVLGVAAIIGGLRRGSRDTIIIGLLGLAISSGFFLLTVWAYIFARGAS